MTGHENGFTIEQWKGIKRTNQTIIKKSKESGIHVSESCIRTTIGSLMLIQMKEIMWKQPRKV